jgi:hypothetical protein
MEKQVGRGESNRIASYNMYPGFQIELAVYRTPRPMKEIISNHDSGQQKFSVMMTQGVEPTLMGDIVGRFTVFRTRVRILGSLVARISLLIQANFPSQSHIPMSRRRGLIQYETIFHKSNKMPFHHTYKNESRRSGEANFAKRTMTFFPSQNPLQPKKHLYEGI